MLYTGTYGYIPICTYVWSWSRVQPCRLQWSWLDGLDGLFLSFFHVDFLQAEDVKYIWIMWLKQFHLHHPPVITIFLDGVTTIPSRLGGLWHCFNHMTCSERPISKISTAKAVTFLCMVRDQVEETWEIRTFVILWITYDYIPSGYG
jgi:hypothetical protein